MSVFQQQSTGFTTPPNFSEFGVRGYTVDPTAQTKYATPQVPVLTGLQPWRLNPAQIPPTIYGVTGYTVDPTAQTKYDLIPWFISQNLLPWWVSAARIPPVSIAPSAPPLPVPLYQGVEPFSYGMRALHYVDPWVSPSQIINHMNNLPGSSALTFSIKLVGVVQNLSIEVLISDEPA